MQEYDVRIKETLEKVVTVEATSRHYLKGLSILSGV